LPLNIPRISFHFPHWVRLTIHGESEFLCVNHPLNLFVVEWEFHFIVVDFVQAAWNVGASINLQIIPLD
ncbi:TPA: hypothetical protein ACG0DN_002625, partial [Enterobacter roggenkampii]